MPFPAVPSARRLLRAALLLLPLGVAGEVVLSLLTSDRHLLEAVAAAPRSPLLVAAAFAFVPWLAHTLRIAIWTRFVGHPLSLRAALRVVAGGVLGSAVTPTAVGGGTFRWALATRYGLPPGKAATLLAVEGVEDALFFVVAVPAALAATAAVDVADLGPAAGVTLARVGEALGLIAVVLLALAGLAALALAGRLGGAARRRSRRAAVRLRRPMRRARADARAVAGLVVRRGKGRFALCLALTSVQWAARYSVATAVIAFLGGPLRPVLYWILHWATYAVSSVVPTPGAAGGAEATFALFFSPFVPHEILGVATAAWRLTLFYAPALAACAVYPLLRGPRPPRPRRAERPVGPRAPAPFAPASLAPG